MTDWLAIELPASARDLSERRQSRLLEVARREVLERTYSGTFAYPFLTATLGVLNGDFDRRPTLIVGLVVATVVVVAVRVALYRKAVADTSTFGRPARGHLLLGVASSAVLSLYACSAFVADGGTAASVAGFVTTAGVAAMVVTIASVRRSLAMVWVWTALAPVLVTTFWLGDASGYGLGLMFGYFGLIITTAVGKSHRVYWEAQLTAARLEEHAQATTSLSRIAGMAEIATQVLHNVGNTLNSVKTTIAELAELDAQDPCEDLGRIANVVSDPGSIPTERLGEFREFVGVVASAAVVRRSAVTSELERLRVNVEHIERVVARQQGVARGLSNNESCGVEELVHAAVDLLGYGELGALDSLAVDVEPSLAVQADRDAVLQILVNVIKNAIEATHAASDPSVEISATTTPSDVVLRVCDNGIGANSETMERIFSRGFTTKKSGHGFGLHSAKSLANAMDGGVGFESPGLGRGAVVTLRLPRVDAAA